MIIGVVAAGATGAGVAIKSVLGRLRRAKGQTKPEGGTPAGEEGQSLDS